MVLNVTMPVLNGFEAAREIKTHVPESAIVILSSHTDKSSLEEARRLGVQAYVAKSKAGEALVNAIEAAVKGEDFFWSCISPEPTAGTAKVAITSAPFP